MASNETGEVQRLLQAARREPGSLAHWEALALAAARIGYQDLDLETTETPALVLHLSQHPESRGLAGLLLAVFGLKVPDKPGVEPTPDSNRPHPVREGVDGWYDSGTGLPLQAMRQRDQAVMRLVALEGEVPFYLDADWVTVAQFRRFLDATEATPPEEWANSGPTPHSPAVFVDHPEARAYAAWVRGTLPLDRQWFLGNGLAEATGAPEEDVEVPKRELWKECFFPPRNEENWGAALAAAVAERSGAGGVHEWTASLFIWPRIPGDAEYFEKLEARQGTGVVVVGPCALGGEGCGKAAFRAGASPDDRQGALGFRVAISLDSAEDPWLLQEREQARRREVERVREQKASERRALARHSSGAMVVEATAPSESLFITLLKLFGAFLVTAAAIIAFARLR